MPKFHISESGNPAPCKATVNACPRGGEADHYSTPQAARQAYEDAQADQLFKPLPSRTAYAPATERYKPSDVLAKLRQWLNNVGLSRTAVKLTTNQRESVTIRTNKWTGEAECFEVSQMWLLRANRKEVDEALEAAVERTKPRTTDPRTGAPLSEAEQRETKYGTIAANYLRNAGLSEWRVQVQDTVNGRDGTLGAADYAAKTILLQRNHLRTADRDAIISTIQHEAAHAKAGQGNGHNHIWKHEAVLLGLSNPTANSFGQESDRQLRAGTAKVKDMAGGGAARGPHRSQFVDRAKPQEVRQEEARERKAARALDPEMIEALKLKYLKKFKQPFDESGLSIPELLQMAARKELD